MTTTMIIDKIKSVMIGHAVGDALGVPVEFASREEIAENPVTDMEGFGTYPYPAGTWSDDTSMSLAALDVLAKGNIDWDGIMDNFGKWLDDGEFTPTGEAFDVGRTCLNAIIRYFNKGTEATESGGADEHSNGNGSLMRIHPFALMSAFNRRIHCNWETFIEKASSLTHAHERSMLACKIYTLILHRLLDIPRKESVSFALGWADCRYDENPEHKHYKRLFSPNFDKTPIAEINNSGYVVDSLEAAIWCLMTTDSYKDCVLKAVNLGGDTDTIAAIAGGLAGALYGYDAIPSEWLDTLIKREYIEELCEKASVTWEKQI